MALQTPRITTSKGQSFSYELNIKIHEEVMKVGRDDGDCFEESPMRQDWQVAAYARFRLDFSLKQHKVVGTESRSGANLDLAFECSLVIDFNTRLKVILQEHFEGRLSRTK